MSNADIIDKLRAREQLCIFEILGGEGDTPSLQNLILNAIAPLILGGTSLFQV